MESSVGQTGTVEQGASSGGIGENYERSSHLYTTRTAEAFEAVEKRSGDKVELWLLRFPIQPNSESASRFCKRIENLSAIGLSTPRIRSYGVDHSGTAYLVTDRVSARSALLSTKGIAEQERVFLDIVRQVAKVHQSGLFLGDIAEDSFVRDQNGQVLIVGLMGNHDTAARQTAMLPPAETFHYLAPEQRGGSGPEAAADIYALGVYGYRLFTGNYFLGDKPMTTLVSDPVLSAPAPSVAKADVPKWVDEVLGRCLENLPEQRYQEAEEMIAVIEKAIKAGTPPGGSGPWSRRNITVQDEGEGEPKKEAAVLRKRAPKVPDAQRTSDQALTMFVWALAIVLGVLAAGFILFSIDALDFSAPVAASKGPGTGEDSIRFHLEYAPAELKPLILELSSTGLPIEKREESLVRISASSDPIAYGVLVATTKNGRELRLKEKAQALLIDRIRRSGLPRAADLLQKWLLTAKQGGKYATVLPAFAQLLPACDPSRPPESRRAMLQQAFSTDPVITLQLAAALALDESEEMFIPVIRKFVTGEMPESELADKGIGALLFSHRALKMFIDQDFSKIVERFSDNDLRWVLLRSAHQDRRQLLDLAKESLKRRLFAPFNAVFLEALVNNGLATTPSPVQQSLVQGALGEISGEDLRQYAMWISIYSERVLLAACAVTNDAGVAADGLDMLAGKTLRTEPANTLMSWLKSRFWEHRHQAAKAFGILGLLDVASPDEINQAFDQLMPYSGGGLFQAMVDTDMSVLILAVLERLGPITSSEDLLPLLAHNDKRIRIATVEALKGRNELSVLQGILHAFESEQDEEVREAYQKSHWVTRERGKKPGA